MKSEFAKACASLVVGDLVSLGIAFWVFDSQAARTAVFGGMIGFTIAMVIRLIGILRRQGVRTPD